MNEVMVSIPCSNDGSIHYARESKISVDSFDSSSTSSGEHYENSDSHDLVAPGLSSSPHSTGQHWFFADNLLGALEMLNTPKSCVCFQLLQNQGWPNLLVPVTLLGLTGVINWRTQVNPFFHVQKELFSWKQWSKYLSNYDRQVMTTLGPYTPQSALKNPPHLMKMTMMMLASEKLVHDFENKCPRSFYLQNNILFYFLKTHHMY